MFVFFKHFGIARQFRRITVVINRITIDLAKTKIATRTTTTTNLAAKTRITNVAIANVVVIIEITIVTRAKELIEYANINE